MESELLGMGGKFQKAMNIKPCKTFIGYSASECGRVFSHRRRGCRVPGHHGGTIENIDPTYVKELRPVNTPKGYLQVSIRIDGKFRPIGIHRLVMDAFVGPPPEGYQVRHLDNDPANNRKCNLAFGTIQDNANDRIKAGHYYSGGRHHNAKLTDDQAAEIRRLRHQKVRVKNLAQRFNVSVPTIEAVIYNKGYKHIDA